MTVTAIITVTVTDRDPAAGSITATSTPMTVITRIIPTGNIATAMAAAMTAATEAVAASKNGCEALSGTEGASSGDDDEKDRHSCRWLDGPDRDGLRAELLRPPLWSALS